MTTNMNKQSNVLGALAAPTMPAAPAMPAMPPPPAPITPPTPLPKAGPTMAGQSAPSVVKSQTGKVDSPKSSVPAAKSASVAGAPMPRPANIGAATVDKQLGTGSQPTSMNLPKPVPNPMTPNLNAGVAAAGHTPPPAAPTAQATQPAAQSPAGGLRQPGASGQSTLRPQGTIEKLDRAPIGTQAINQQLGTQVGPTPQTSRVQPVNKAFIGGHEVTKEVRGMAPEAYKAWSENARANPDQNHIQGPALRPGQVQIGNGPVQQTSDVTAGINARRPDLNPDYSQPVVSEAYRNQPGMVGHGTGMATQSTPITARGFANISNPVKFDKLPGLTGGKFGGGSGGFKGMGGDSQATRLGERAASQPEVVDQGEQGIKGINQLPMSLPSMSQVQAMNGQAEAQPTAQPVQTAQPTEAGGGILSRLAQGAQGVGRSLMSGIRDMTGQLSPAGEQNLQSTTKQEQADEQARQQAIMSGQNPDAIKAGSVKRADDLDCLSPVETETPNKLMKEKREYEGKTPVYKEKGTTTNAPDATVHVSDVATGDGNDPAVKGSVTNGNSAFVPKEAEFNPLVAYLMPALYKQASVVTEYPEVKKLIAKGHELAAMPGTGDDRADMAQALALARQQKMYVHGRTANGNYVLISNKPMTKKANETITLNAGGLAEKSPEKAVKAITEAPCQLQAGKRVESEHTQDPNLQKAIAADHLVEDGQYYTHLKAMEQAVKQEKPVAPAVKESRAITPDLERGILDFVKTNPNLDDQTLDEYATGKGIDPNTAREIIHMNVGKEVAKSASLQQAFARGIAQFVKSSNFRGPVSLLTSALQRMAPEFSNGIGIFAKQALISDSHGGHGSSQGMGQEAMKGIMGSMQGQDQSTAAQRFMQNKAQRELKTRKGKSKGIVPHPQDVFGGLGNRMAIKQVAGQMNPAGQSDPVPMQGQIAG